jgi:Protein of unknown function (DUF2510)
MATATKAATTNGRAPATTARTPVRAEGWYPDPKTRPGQRYWDGKDWTAHLAPPGMMLKLCCILGAIAAVGLGIAAVMAKIVDSGPVTMAGGIAVISAGLLFVTLTVGFVVNFYRKRMLKDESELQPEQGTSS